jgi:PleD family two-component response regulator
MACFWNPKLYMRSQIAEIFSLSSNNNITTAKKRIMIVDDEVDITNLLRMVFVEIFNDSLLALSSYKTGACDLLLLDINMPRMNGFRMYHLAF